MMEEQTDSVLSVVVVDPDPLARRVIGAGIDAADELSVVAQGSTGADAVRLVSEHGPSLLLMEDGLPDGDGVAVVRRVAKAAPGLGIVIFATGVERERELALLRAGASGLLAKDVGVPGAISALQAVARGEAAISRSTTMALVELLRRVPEGGVGIRPVRSSLTDREWEVLDLLATGATTPQIAERLVLSQETIYSHVKNIMRKLGVNSRAEAIAAVSRLMEPLPAG